MKEEIINISKNNGIDVIGFCDIHNLKVNYSKYELQDKLEYKCSFQVGNIDDKNLTSIKYKEYNTAIVIGLSYNKVDFSNSDKVYLSSCSVGKDYHLVLKSKLNIIGSYLERNKYKYKIYVDDNPIDERLLAYNAGLGYFGLNNLLINDSLGSYFFIGVLLTDLTFEYDKIIDKTCMNCKLCIKSCPTKALNKHGILNSNKCLSYLTQKMEVDKKYTKVFNNCIYGCDKCISVCPHNKKIKSSNFKPLNNEVIDPYEFLNLEKSEYKRIYSNNSCFWRGKKVLDRNIKFYINNLKKK